MTSALNSYKQKVTQMEKDLTSLLNQGNNVYSNTLINNQRASDNNENNALNNYKDDRRMVTAIKTNNAQEILSKDIYYGKEELRYINDVTEKYEGEFNENVVKLNFLNKELMTKSKMILLNEDEADKKDNINYILKSVAFYLFLMLLPISFIKFGILLRELNIMIIVVSGIITLIVVAVVASRNRDINLVKKTKQTAKDYSIPILQKIVPKGIIKECPAKCMPKKPVYSEEQVNPSYGNKNVSGNEVWLDNSTNVWEDGYVPEIGGTKLGYQQLGKNMEPKPYYDGIQKPTKYVCRWKGDPTKMTNMNKGQEFTTTIPCNFFPGYETIKKM